MKNIYYILLIIFCVSISAVAQKIPVEKNPLVRFEKSIENGNAAEVERELFNYLIENPKDAAGYLLLARVRFNQSRLGEAKSLADKALKLDPKLISARFLNVAIHVRLGEIDDARSVLAGISDNDVSDDASRLKLAESFVSVGDCPKALASLGKLPTVIKNSEGLAIRAECSLSSGDRSEFDKLIPLAIAAAGKAPLAGLKFARVLTGAALYSEAAPVLRLVVASAPLNPDALLLLAKSEIYLRDYALADSLLLQAVKLTPGSAELFFVKSILANERRDTVLALEFLEKSLAVNPNSKEVLSSFVLTAIRANQNSKALRAAEKLLGFESENPEFIYLFGAASLQNKNLEAAETSLTKFMNLRPNDSRGCLALGFALAAQEGKLEEARGRMKKCLEINPKNFEAAYQLGLSYKVYGETALAIEYLEKTVSLSPDYAAGLRDLGIVYLQSGNETKARFVLEKAAVLKPGDADTHFQLSRLYNLTGEKALARKHFEIFQKLNKPVKKGM